VLGLGLLRRLLVGEPDQGTEADDEDLTESGAAQRIEAARQRLKETFPPPDDDA
jgi:hypothetical protein